jgi:hypothetical protein
MFGARERIRCDGGDRMAIGQTGDDHRSRTGVAHNGDIAVVGRDGKLRMHHRRQRQHHRAEQPDFKMFSFGSHKKVCLTLMMLLSNKKDNICASTKGNSS